MTTVTATNIEVGGQVKVATQTYYHNHSCGVTQSPRDSEASEFATVASIDKGKGAITFTFTDGRIMFTHSNSKVTTS